MVKPAPHLAAVRVERFKRLTGSQRSRAVGPAEAARIQSCPYEGGGVCDLDVRRHYHRARYPSGAVEVVEYGSARDLQIQILAAYERIRQPGCEPAWLPAVAGFGFAEAASRG